MICQQYKMWTIMLIIVLQGGSLQISIESEHNQWAKIGLIEGRMKVNEVNIDGLMKLVSINRSIDGRNNNLKHTEWGGSFINLERKTPAIYQDGIGQPITNLPNTRFISQSVAKLKDNKVIPNQFNLTALWGTFGQFLDHDITLTDQQSDSEEMVVRIPRCDPFYDPDCKGTEELNYSRSKYNKSQKIRTHFNELTAWIDASQVYGSTLEVMKSLRTFSNGKLKTSSGNLLPIDETNNFYAGDIRCEENMGLTTLHILFLREHNRLCDLLKKYNPTLTDQDIFRAARNYVIALIQKIAMQDYLPSLFGKGHFEKYIGKYQGYNQSANPNIFTQFSTTAYRIGHPYVTNKYNLVDNNNKTVKVLSLYDMFLAIPGQLTYFTVNLLMKGLSKTLAKDRTLQYVDELRNVPQSLLGKNLDLFVTNTERGRDHGAIDYNNMRAAYGLPKYNKFSQLFSIPEDAYILEKAYGSINNVDPYVGILAETKLVGSFFGELGAIVAGNQFKSIRDGDRFWYESSYPAEVIKEIQSTTISDLIMRNSDVIGMSLDGFHCHDCR